MSYSEKYKYVFNEMIFIYRQIPINHDAPFYLQ